MEAEVFLLGHWKNFQELEDNLSLEELQATLDAIRKKEEREREFLAALNGVDLTTTETQDVSDLNSRFTAEKEGFGAGEGLGFLSLE